MLTNPDVCFHPTLLSDVMGSAGFCGGTRDEEGVGEPRTLAAPFGTSLRVGEATL